MRAVVGGLTLLVLLAGACSSDLETPAQTLAGGGQPDSPFGYVIDALPEDYDLCAISTPSALSLAPDTAASLHVYGNTGLDDPYSGPLYGVALFPAGELDELVLGEVVDVQVGEEPGRLGGIEGLQLADLPVGTGRLLTYRADPDRLIQLSVRGDEGIDLVDLARNVAVSADSATLRPDALPPGFSDLGDLYQLEGRPRFRFALDYQRRSNGGDLEDQITLLGLDGDFGSMEAFRFRAATSERVDVDGAPGVMAQMGVPGQGRAVVTWAADDDLILRLFSLGLDPQELLEVAHSARRVDGKIWVNLRNQFDPATCQF